MYRKDVGRSGQPNHIRPKIYATWLRMRHRCLGNSKDARYYKDRGITICDEWRDNYDAFRSWAIKQDVRMNLTLDRIDNDGNYEPSNCRWVSQAEQSSNKRHNGKYLYPARKVREGTGNTGP